MPIDRHVITDRQWSKMEPLCLGKASDPGRTGGDARLFLEGVFWIARTGAQWCDPLPGSACLHAREGAGRVRQVEHGLPPVQGLGASRSIRAHFQCLVR